MVLNIEESIAITQNLTNEHNLKDTIRCLKESCMEGGDGTLVLKEFERTLST